MGSSVTFAPKGTVSAFTAPQVDAWIVRDVACFNDFLAIYDEKSAAALDHHVLSSLDNYDQADYTSGHAMGKYDLDPENEGASPDVKFADTYRRFMQHVGTASFEALAGRLTWQDKDEAANLIALNTDPNQCLDALIVMQIVPVKLPEDALSAFPNGYFTDDLTPFENYALAAYLRTTYDYKLIAIGASYLCFLRANVLDGADLDALSTDIGRLYADGDGALSVKDLAQALMGKRYLILSYVNI
jgi:hypothetical protein